MSNRSCSFIYSPRLQFEISQLLGITNNKLPYIILDKRFNSRFLVQDALTNP